MKNESLARDIIEHISDAALELAIIRHVLSDEEGDELETERVVMIKSDVVACMTGDDIGCNDPDELDETNCEILWLDKVLTTTRLEAAREADERATRNFRWAYQLLLALAKRRLADANAERVNENDWPAGQQWHEMNGTSHSIFLRRAREEAGIPDDAFLGVIRSLECDVEDLYEAAANTIE